MASEPSEQVGEHLMFENEEVRVWDIDLRPGSRFRSTSITSIT